MGWCGAASTVEEHQQWFYSPSKILETWKDLRFYDFSKVKWVIPQCFWVLNAAIKIRWQAPKKPSTNPMNISSTFSWQLWALVMLGAFIIGLAKAGLKGVEMLNVTIMALVFGGKASTGVVLPMLCVADILAVMYYNRHAQWSHFWRLLPWIILGVLVGVYVGNVLEETVFKKIMAAIILLIVVVMAWLEYRQTAKIPNSRWFASFMGIATGFTTMLGNLAGPLSTIYFLALRLSKNDLIGTAAWLFLVINLFKLPFQVFVWHNVTFDTLQLNLMLLPSLFVGFFVGIKVVSIMQDNNYRRVILGLTLLGALVIFMR